MNKIILFLLFALSTWVTAQENPRRSQDQPNGQNEHVNVRGCVGRASGDFILMQTDPGNSYALQASPSLKLESFLGKQVEVAGTESPTTSTSSNFKREPATSATITVTSITTISKRCTH